MHITQSIADWQRGFHRDHAVLQCNYCSLQLPVGADAAMAQHIATAHGGQQAALLNSPAKFNSLTANQRTLLAAFANGQSDDDIAAMMGVSTSTIRHQRFTFRTKAERARLYLAQFRTVFGDNTTASDPLLPLPDTTFTRGITVSTTEYAQAVTKYFGPTHDDITLKSWPRREKLRLMICYRIRMVLDPSVIYTRTDFVTIITNIWPDYAQITRDLIDFGFVRRTDDGRQYWRIF